MNQIDTLSKSAAQWGQVMIDFATKYGLRLLGAIVVLFVGLWLIGLLTRSTHKMMSRGNIDPSLSSFLKSMMNILFKILLIISVLGMMGVQMTSLSLF